MSKYAIILKKPKIVTDLFGEDLMDEYITSFPMLLLQSNLLIGYVVFTNLDSHNSERKRRKEGIHDAYIWGGNLQINEFNIDDEFPCQRYVKCPNKIFVILDLLISNFCRYTLIRMVGGDSRTKKSTPEARFYPFPTDLNINIFIHTETEV